MRPEGPSQDRLRIAAVCEEAKKASVHPATAAIARCIAARTETETVSRHSLNCRPRRRAVESHVYMRINRGVSGIYAYIMIGGVFFFFQPNQTRCAGRAENENHGVHAYTYTWAVHDTTGAGTQAGWRASVWLRFCTAVYGRCVRMGQKDLEGSLARVGRSMTNMRPQCGLTVTLPPHIQGHPLPASPSARRAPAILR